MQIVFCYLALIRLLELTFPVYRKFMLCFDAVKLSQFLDFLFDPANIQETPRPGKLTRAWYTLYDPPYVQKTIVEPLQAMAPAALALREELIGNSQRGNAHSKSDRRVTQIHPFNLTEGHATVVEVHEEEHKAIKVSRQRQDIDTAQALPIPKTMYQVPEERKEIERARERNQRKAKDLYELANRESFGVVRRTVSDTTRKVQTFMTGQTSDRWQRLEEIDRAEAAKLDFNRRKAHPYKPSQAFAPVKLTAAAILREEAVIRRKQDEEDRVLHEAEIALHDASEYNRWQEEMRFKDEEVARREQEKRRLAVQIHHESAIQSRQEAIQANKYTVFMTASSDQNRRAKVKEVKDEEAEMRARQEEFRREVVRENRVKIVVGQLGHEKARLAKSAVFEKKQRQGQLALFQWTHILLAALIQDELLKQRIELERAAREEQERKAEYIREIKALEASNHALMTSNEASKVDLTATGNLGLMTEMSIAEVRY